ncbi:hypothetical protein Tco_1224483 [Tanacetum coccineum]
MGGFGFSNYKKKSYRPPNDQYRGAARNQPRKRLSLQSPTSSSSSSSSHHSPQDLATFYSVASRVLSSFVPTPEDIALRVTLIKRFKEWTLGFEKLIGCTFEPYGSYDTHLYTRFGLVPFRILLHLALCGPSIHKDWSRGTKVFDGESIGLKGGIVVVEVVVKWNDSGWGGICEGIKVKGGKRLSCTLCAFWITAFKWWEKSWSLPSSCTT